MAKTKGILTTLAFDGTSFTEYYGDGHQLIYQAQSQVGNPVVHQLMVNVEPAGTRQTFAYGTGTEAGLLKTIEVNDGNLVTFNYGPGTNTSLLYTLEDWGARIWTYQYDVNDCCTTVTQPSGCITKYGIDAFQRVKTRQNPQGFLATYAYSGSGGQMFKATVADGARFYHFDDVDNSYTAETLPNGAIVTYNGAGLPGSIQTPDGTTTVVNYDANDIESAKDSPFWEPGNDPVRLLGLSHKLQRPSRIHHLVQPRQLRKLDEDPISGQRGCHEHLRGIGLNSLALHEQGSTWERHFLLLHKRASEHGGRSTRVGDELPL